MWRGWRGEGVGVWRGESVGIMGGDESVRV